MATWSYTVTVLTDDSTNVTYSPAIDISKYVISIENMTDVGTGEINSATMTLRAQFGEFITESNGSASAALTPKLGEFDKIKIALEDKNGDTYDRILEVHTLNTLKSVTEGTRLVVHLLGQEKNIMGVHFSKQYYYADAYYVAKNIIEQYNGHKGSKQATVTYYDDANYNELPKWTANNYDFGMSESYCYNGLMDVINKLGNTISAGGAGDFFELIFDDDPSAINRISFNSFSSGSKPTSSNIQTIQSSTISPVYNISGTVDQKTGTIVVGKGATNYGTMPAEASKYWSTVEEWLAIPDWKSTETGYPSGTRVVADNKRYVADPSGTYTTPGSFVSSEWDEILIADLLGSLNYSPWTNNGSTDGYKLWKNSGTNVTSTTTSGFTMPGCFDSNLEIRDEDSYCTWVDLRVCSTAVGNGTGEIPADFAYGGTALYRGMRLLVDSSVGTLAGDFAQNSGKDRFGINFNKGICRHRGTSYTGSEGYKNWDVIRGTNGTGWNLLKNNNYCAVIKEATVYKYTSSGTTWNTNLTANAGNFCFHPFRSISNESGVATHAKQTAGGSETGTYGDNSAVMVENRWNLWTSKSQIINGYNDQDYYSRGCWLNIRFPFPINSKNGQTLASKFGGTTSTGQEPATIDTAGMHMTPTGLTGFNAADSEELGPMSAIQFWTKIAYTDDNELPLLGHADFKMRCTIYDTSGNVAIYDYTVPFNSPGTGKGNWFQVTIPLSSFKIYRARSPWNGTEAAAGNMLLPDLEVLEVFEFKNLKQISIQTQDSYDDEARYRPEFGRFGLVAALTAGQRLKMFIDDFHFIKQLTATSGVDSDRNITPDFLQRPFTTNYVQLKNDVDGQLEVEKFKYRAWDIETEGECNQYIKPGYSFYLKDANTVNQVDNGVANNVKLVARKIEYSLTGTSGGRGGFTRKILGVQRIT